MAKYVKGVKVCLCLILFNTVSLLFYRWYSISSAWFLEIDPVRIISMCVCICMSICPPQRLLITSGVMWRDIDSI